MERVEIEDASWMTVEQVLALRNCKKVELWLVRFDESSINKILLEWMENPGELQEVHMFLSLEMNLEQLIKGLKVSRVEEGDDEDDDEDKKYWIERNNGLQFSMTIGWLDSVVIKRET
uniref:FBA_2 domain-containing protein n=1 Tax=Caenorhabditis tropicalis TaxID=1561998 RepID=A0A1I7UT62_9PELO